jgi:flagellar motor switch/type III secretory pathway protein FliN
MALPFSPWLPSSALDSPAIDEALRASVREWSAKWFARGGLRPSGPFARGNIAKLLHDKVVWRAVPDGLAVGAAERATGALAAAMLDADFSGTNLLPKDRQLIERLAGECLEDLRIRLARLFGLPEKLEWQESVDPPRMSGEVWTCRFGLNDREPLVWLAVDRARVVMLRRSRLRRSSDGVRLRPMAEALAKQPLALSARLGRCEITLSDLTALSEGDVIVLDRRLDEPLELAVEGQVKPGCCLVEEADDDQLRLKISTPPSFG